MEELAVKIEVCKMEVSLLHPIYVGRNLKNEINQCTILLPLFQDFGANLLSRVFERVDNLIAIKYGELSKVSLFIPVFIASSLSTCILNLENHYLNREQ